MIRNQKHILCFVVSFKISSDHIVVLHLEISTFIVAVICLRIHSKCSDFFYLFFFFFVGCCYPLIFRLLGRTMSHANLKLCRYSKRFFYPIIFSYYLLMFLFLEKKKKKKQCVRFSRNVFFSLSLHSNVDLK